MLKIETEKNGSELNSASNNSSGTLTIFLK